MSTLGVVVAVAVLASGAEAAVIQAGPTGTTRDDPAQQRISYKAGPGEVNRLTVTQPAPPAAIFVFTDVAGITITDGDGPLGGCEVSAITPNVATCPSADVSRIGVDAGDGNDFVTMSGNPGGAGVSVPDGTVLHGGTGNDQLFGGPGADRLFGGPGADRIYGWDGPDYVDTGVGRDTTNVRRRDVVGGGNGFDTISYANRDFGVYVDTRSWNAPTGTGNIAVDDPDPTCMTTPNLLTTRPTCEVDAFAGSDGTGNDFFERIIGGPGNDELIGSKFANTLIGNGGADTLCGGQGVDTVDYSGKGNEGVDVSLNGKIPTDPNSALGGIEGAQARIDCRFALKQFSTSVPQPPDPANPENRDCVADDGTRAHDGVPAEHDCVGEDVENVIGTNGNDNLVGNSPDKDVNEGPNLEPRGINVLEGRGGDDTLDGKFGADVLNGGSNPAGTPPDRDTVTYADRSEGISATIDGMGNDGSDTDRVKGITGDFDPISHKSDDIGTDVENVIGGSGDDTLAGDGNKNLIQGNDGADNIDAGAGDDTVDAGAGDDVVKGGDGADNVSAGAGNDVVDGGAGNDNLPGGGLDGGEGNDTLRGGPGADTLIGGAGRDVADWSDATSGVSVTLNDAADDGSVADLESAGSTTRDFVSSDIESANGGLADDHLVLGVGDGFIDGGPGNDTIDGGPGADTIIGGSGLDRADYSSRVSPVSVDVNSSGGDGEGGENDDVSSDVETLVGGSAGDVLVGGAAASILIGNGGSDQLFGGGGNDQLFGGAEPDLLDGGDANDTLGGGDAGDTLMGQSGADTLMGNAGDDALDGGSGPDSLGGGDGSDRAFYASRTKALSLTLDGNSNDGEAGENDVIKLDVEATTAGAANDVVNSRNGVKNSVSCGRGTDRIAADTFDDIGGDCEVIMNTSPCKTSPEPATMSKSGVVTIKVSCTDDATGSLQLRTAGAVKTGKGKRARAKKLSLGRGSFKAKRGQAVKVKVRIKGAGKKAIKRNKRGIDARATLTVRQSFGVRALSLKNGDGLKIKAKR